MQIRYIGPFDQVQIAGLADVIDRNGVVDVPDDLAAQLVLQADWEAAAKAKKNTDPAVAG